MGSKLVFGSKKLFTAQKGDFSSYQTVIFQIVKVLPDVAFYNLFWHF